MKFSHHARFLAALQLLPALESGEETLVGGQAVLEGVMMRSPHAWAITVRNPSGGLVSHAEPLDRPSDKHKWMGWPMLRGVITLGYAMVLGFRALRFSANVALEEPEKKGDAAPAEGPLNSEGAPPKPDVGLSGEVAAAAAKPAKKFEISGWVAAVNIIISVGFFIFMYKFLPLLAATHLKQYSSALRSQIGFNVADGIVRLLLFLLFIWATSLWKDLRRVYEYHGAEHKTVFAFESGAPLNIQNAQRFSTFHPRCGTSFLMTVMLLSIVAYTLVPVTSFAGRFAVRIVLLPVIAGASYEVIRFAARLRSRNSNSPGLLFTVLTAPGMWMQRITTQPPSDDQVECAISALDRALELERARGGELVIA